MNVLQKALKKIGKYLKEDIYYENEIENDDVVILVPAFHIQKK